MVLEGFHIRRPKYQFEHLNYVGTSPFICGKPPAWDKSCIDSIFSNFLETEPQLGQQMLEAADYAGVIIDEKRYIKSFAKCDFPNVKPTDFKLNKAIDYIFQMLSPIMIGKRFQSRVKFNPKTSCGEPYMHMINPDTNKLFKCKGEFLNSSIAESEIESFHEPVSAIFPKIEFLPCSDLMVEKLRSIFNAEVTLTMKQKHLYDAQDDALKESADDFLKQWSRYGYTKQFGGIHYLASAHLTLKGDNILHKMADVSGWDRRFPLMKEVYELRKRWYEVNGPMSEIELQLHNYISRNMEHPYVSLTNGDIYQRHCGNISGSGKTSSDNTIGHMIIEMYALITLYYNKHGVIPDYDLLLKETRISLYGDDDLSSYNYLLFADSVDEFINTYRDIYKTFGLEIKDKAFRYNIGTVNGLEFLGATFSYNSKSRRFVGEPRWGKIAATLCYELDGARTPNQYVSILEAVTMLCYDVPGAKSEFFRSFISKYALFVLQTFSKQLDSKDIIFLCRVADSGSRHLNSLIHGYESKSQFFTYSNSSEVKSFELPENFFFTEKQSRRRAVVGFKSDMLVSNNKYDPHTSYYQIIGNKRRVVKQNNCDFIYDMTNIDTSANYINYIDQTLLNGIGTVETLFDSLPSPIRMDSAIFRATCILHVDLRSKGKGKYDWRVFADAPSKKDAKQKAYQNLLGLLSHLKLANPKAINEQLGRTSYSHVRAEKSQHKIIYDCKLDTGEKYTFSQCDNLYYINGSQTSKIMFDDFLATCRAKTDLSDRCLVTRDFLYLFLQNIRQYDTLSCEEKSSHLFSVIHDYSQHKAVEVLHKVFKANDISLMDPENHQELLQEFTPENNYSWNSFEPELDLDTKMNALNISPAPTGTGIAHTVVSNNSMRSMPFNFNLMLVLLLCCLIPLVNSQNPELLVRSYQSGPFPINNFSYATYYWGTFTGKRQTFAEGLSLTTLADSLGTTTLEYEVDTMIGNILTYLYDSFQAGIDPDYVVITNTNCCQYPPNEVFYFGTIITTSGCKTFFSLANVTTSGAYGNYDALFCENPLISTNNLCYKLNNLANNTNTFPCVGEENSCCLPSDNVICAPFIGIIEEGNTPRFSKEYRNGFNPYGNGQWGQTKAQFMSSPKRSGWSKQKKEQAWTQYLASSQILKQPRQRKQQQQQQQQQQPAKRKAPKPLPKRPQRDIIAIPNKVMIPETNSNFDNHLSECATRWLYSMVYPFDVIEHNTMRDKYFKKRFTEFVNPCIPYPPSAPARRYYVLRRNLSVTLNDFGELQVLFAPYRFANNYAVTESSGNGSLSAPPILYTGSPYTTDWGQTFLITDTWDTTTLTTSIGAVNMPSDYPIAALAPSDPNPLKSQIISFKLVAAAIQYFYTGQVLQLAGMQHYAVHPTHGSLSGIAISSISGWPSYFCTLADRKEHTVTYTPVHPKEYDYCIDYSQLTAMAGNDDLPNNENGNHFMGVMITGGTPGATYNFNFIQHLEATGGANITNVTEPEVDIPGSSIIMNVAKPGLVGAIGEAPGALAHIAEFVPQSISNFASGVRSGLMGNMDAQQLQAKLGNVLGQYMQKKVVQHVIG